MISKGVAQSGDLTVGSSKQNFRLMQQRSGICNRRFIPQTSFTNHFAELLAPHTQPLINQSLPLRIGNVMQPPMQLHVLPNG